MTWRELKRSKLQQNVLCCGDILLKSILSRQKGPEQKTGDRQKVRHFCQHLTLLIFINCSSYCSSVLWLWQVNSYSIGHVTRRLWVWFLVGTFIWTSDIFQHHLFNFKCFYKNQKLFTDPNNCDTFCLGRFLCGN